jgi:hypothetical protein
MSDRGIFEPLEDVSLNVYKDKRTGGIQLSIDNKDGGYRLKGPKFSGASQLLLSHNLSEMDIREIRDYCNRALRKARSKRNKYLSKRNK